MNKICKKIFYLSVLFLFANTIVARNSIVDSLRNTLTTTKNDTNKVIALNQLSKYAGWRISNYDTALYYAQKAKKIARQLNYQKGIAKSYDNIGVVYALQTEYDKSLKNYTEALNIYKKIGFKKGIAEIDNNLGIIFLNQGNYPEALEKYLASLKIRKKIGDKEGVARAYINIGLVYSNQGNYPKALEKYFAALKMYEKIGNQRVIGLLYNNIGVVYYNQKNYDKALANYLSALGIRKQIGDKFGIAATIMNAGITYDAEGQYKDALAFYLRALKINQQIGNENGIAYCYNYLGNTELKLKHYKSALSWQQKALELSKQLNTKKNIRDAYKNLSEIYLALSKYKSSYQNYKMYILYRDSLKNKANTKKITQLQMQFKFDQKQAADSISHAKEKEIQQAKIAKQKALIKVKRGQQYVMFGGLLLVLVFAGFMYNRFKKTQKQKKIIETQKARTEFQKQLVETKNKEISDSINYAKRIQDAILPSSSLFSENLQNSFVLFKPKDIVSGDFYWLETAPQGGAVYFAAADCTGHGVPGAMVSVVCANALNKALLEENITETGKILDRTREIVIQQFSHSDENVKDGMDISLCKLTPTEAGGGLLQWSGANNPLWIIHQSVIASPINREKQSQSNYELTELKANKQPIGVTDNPKPFTTHNIELQKGDSIYIFSDGFADQFGGEDGKKFKYKPLKELLLSIKKIDMDAQKQAINNAFENWKGNQEQVDDVCVIGVRL